MDCHWRHSASTINLRLAAVRRLSFEAADCGLLSPELAAGIQRVKGAKKFEVRLGNWLTADQCRSLLRAPDGQTLKGRRDRAILAILLGPHCSKDSSAIEVPLNAPQSENAQPEMPAPLRLGGARRFIPGLRSAEKMPGSAARTRYWARIAAPRRFAETQSPEDPTRAASSIESGWFRESLSQVSRWRGGRFACVSSSAAGVD